MNMQIYDALTGLPIPRGEPMHLLVLCGSGEAKRRAAGGDHNPFAMYQIVGLPVECVLDEHDMLDLTAAGQDVWPTVSRYFYEEHSVSMDTPHALQVWIDEAAPNLRLGLR